MKNLTLLALLAMAVSLPAMERPNIPSDLPSVPPVLSLIDSNKKEIIYCLQCKMRQDRGLQLEDNCAGCRRFIAADGKKFRVACDLAFRLMDARMWYITK